MTWNLPNILTVYRLAAAPSVAFVFLFLPRPFADWAALILFVSGSITDWIDGYLARKWDQHSRFGAMLDPIADKMMVVIALAVLLGLLGLGLLITVPVVVILFREFFVSGLREYLGNKAGTLKVTNLAKWKTTVQMLAISLLFAWGLFQHYFFMHTYGMGTEIIDGVLAGDVVDELGIVWKYYGAWTTYYGGLGLLWLAALLTFITGADYMIKAMPYLQDTSND